MAGHTPGPWRAVQCRGLDGKPLGPWQVNWYTPDSGIPWAVCQLDQLAVEANARLIAAAPALLEALEDLLNPPHTSWCDGRTEDGDCPCGFRGAAQRTACAAVERAS